MTWIDIVWPMLGGASLALGLIHLAAWIERPRQIAQLMFTLAAVSVAILSIIELRLMGAQSAAFYAEALHWGHPPLTVFILSLLCFVRLHFKAGWLWLAYVVLTLRVVYLVADFASGTHFNFAQVTALHSIDFLGAENVTIPEGPPNPLMAIGQFSNLLLFVFLISAIVEVWRRGDHLERWRALLVCGSIIVFLVAASVWIALVAGGVVQGPLTVNAAFFVVLLVMSYVLGGDIIRASRLAEELAASESDLRHSEQRIRLAARAAGLGMWTLDLNSNELWFTETSHVMLGWSAGAHIDRDAVLDRVHPDDREAFARARIEAIRTGEYACEFRVVLPTGQLRWIAANGRVEYGSPGRATSIRGVVIDITEKRQAEERYAIQRDELAHLSRVTLLGEMSGSLAHELNQPLTVILSNAQAGLRFLGRDSPDLDEIRDCLVHIVENDKRASEVIRRLRTMLRKEEVEYQPLDVNELVHEVMRLMNNDVVNRNVTVILELGIDLPLVHGDRVQLQQVLLNLVINACDAMSSSRGRRTVTLRTCRSAGRGVEVLVSDNGTGIPEDQLEQIFSPFVTTKAEGIGLGLAICRTIIQAHHGALWATNNESGGATLHFELPALAAALQTDDPPSAQLSDLSL